MRRSHPADVKVYLVLSLIKCFCLHFVVGLGVSGRTKFSLTGDLRRMRTSHVCAVFYENRTVLFATLTQLSFSLSRMTGARLFPKLLVSTETL